MSHYVTAIPFQKGSVRGFLHQPEAPAQAGLVLTHGAGGNCAAPLLVGMAGAFCAAGYCVLRCDLWFRQRGSSGPPSPATSERDRDSLREAVTEMRSLVEGSVVLGGHSYGGRQATMLAAQEHSLADALLLLSYPLHPPGKPAQLRTAHFPALLTPSLFLQGTSDPFGTLEEMEIALRLIPAQTHLLRIDKAGHDLGRGRFDLGNMALANLAPLLQR